MSSFSSLPPSLSSQAKPTIAIIGATGVLGGSVARHFTHYLDFHIRTITRRPQFVAAETLRKAVPSIDVLSGDLNDLESLIVLFRPASVVYVTTYYWAARRDPKVEQLAATEGISIDEAALNHVDQHHRNLFNAIAFVNAEREASGSEAISRVIVSMLPSPQQVSHGKYSSVHHFESKARGLALLRQEANNGNEGFLGVLSSASFIYTGVYLDSFFNAEVRSPDGRPVFGPDKQSDGSFLFRQVAAPPYHKLPILCPERDFGRLVGALALNAPPGTHLMGGQPRTLREIVDCWGSALDVPVRWQPAEIDEVLQDAPEAFRSFLRGPLESSAFVTEYGFDGGIGAKWPEELGVQESDFKSLRAWIQETDWSRWSDVPQLQRSRQS